MMFTLQTLPQTIAHVRTMDQAYADYMQKKYVNFLPGGRYA